jgi:hypothetical protein
MAERIAHVNRVPWLEARLRRVHEGVVDEPLPNDMLESVRRLDAKTEPDDSSGASDA